MPDQARHERQTRLRAWQEPGELSVPRGAGQGNPPRGTPTPGRAEWRTRSLGIPLGTVPGNCFQTWLRLWDCSGSLLTTDLAGGVRAGGNAQREISSAPVTTEATVLIQAETFCAMWRRSRRSPVPSTSPSQPQSTPLHFAPQVDPDPPLRCPQELQPPAATPPRAAGLCVLPHRWVCAAVLGYPFAKLRVGFTCPEPVGRRVHHPTKGG